jgi:hypothetical protein
MWNFSTASVAEPKLLEMAINGGIMRAKFC